MSGFELEKWYLDAIDDQGHACIGYSARLRWKSIQLSYNNYTYLNTKSSLPSKSESSFSSTAFPTCDEKNIFWKFKNIAGEWQRIDQPVKQILLKNENGEIDWSCLFPKTTTNIQIGTLKLKNCLGYAERINISMLPWNIPIEKLHWGRYLSREDTIIWIRWEGPVKKDLIYHNGEHVEVLEIQTKKIRFGNYCLSLENSISIRKGTVLSTVFSKFPRIAKLFPSKITSLKEDKWVSDGYLKKNDTIISQSKVIHEYVVWS